MRINLFLVNLIGDFKIEDALYGKFKEWNAQKSVDNKVSTRNSFFSIFILIFYFSIVHVNSSNRANLTYYYLKQVIHHQQ
jgi:hypothetical protein